MLTDITGTATRESPGTIVGVEVRIQRDSDSYYWDGVSSWTNTTTWLDATCTTSSFDSPSENWKISTTTTPKLPTWQDGITYTVEAVAEDNYGEKDTTPAQDSFTYDVTAPTTTIDPIADTVSELEEITGTAEDPGYTVAEVEVKVKDVDASEYWNGTSWTTTTTWVDATNTGTDFSTWKYADVPTWQDGDYEIEARAVDKARNVGTPVGESFTFELALTLDTIVWTDVNGSGTINVGDTLRFSFSKAVDTVTLSSVAYINSRLDSTAPGSSDYGTTFAFAWNSDEDRLTVTLGAGEAIQGGETVNPSDLVKDIEGNSDETTAPGPAIPTAPGPEGFVWLWWHYLLIGLGALIVLLGLVVLFLRMRKPPVPPEVYEEEL